ncbi:unnamed protein product, partial [Amoebophrya sp. A120]|eukprot:GSA120T00001084001.1
MAGGLGRAPGSLPQFIPVRRSYSVSCRRRPVLVSFACLLFFCDSAAAGQGNRVEDDLQQYGNEGVVATGYNSGFQSSNMGPSPLAAGRQGLVPRTRDRNRPNRRSRNAGGAGASSSNYASSSAYHAHYNPGVAGGATRFALTPGLVLPGGLPLPPLLQRASSETTTSSSTHMGVNNFYPPAGDLGRPFTRSAREEQGDTSNFYASGVSTLEPGPQSSLPSCSGDVLPAHLSRCAGAKCVRHCR